jgi:hypothetical protein
LGRAVGSCQGGTYTAARAGDENGAGILHPGICTASGRENKDTGYGRYRSSAKEAQGMASRGFVITACLLQKATLML